MPNKVWMMKVGMGEFPSFDGMEMEPAGCLPWVYSTKELAVQSAAEALKDYETGLEEGPIIWDHKSLKDGSEEWAYEGYKVEVFWADLDRVWGS